MSNTSDPESEDTGTITIVIPHTIKIRRRSLWAAVAVVMALLTIAPVAAVVLASNPASPGGGVAPPPTSSGSGATVNCQNPCKVVIKNSVFGTGQPVVIAKGTQVIWVNSDDTAHTSTSNSGIWDSGILQVGQSSQPVTFNSDGVFPYFCNVHPMTGVVQVVG